MNVHFEMLLGSVLGCAFFLFVLVRRFFRVIYGFFSLIHRLNVKVHRMLKVDVKTYLFLYSSQ